MNDDVDFQIARFGIEVDAFLDSEIGKFILGMAENSRNDAIEALKTVDVTDVSAITKIKNDISIPDLIVGWLQDAIRAGMAKEAQIKDEVYND